jgi:hypothetical protein
VQAVAPANFESTAHPAADLQQCLSEVAMQPINLGVGWPDIPGAFTAGSRDRSKQLTEGESRPRHNRSSAVQYMAGVLSCLELRLQ